MTVRLRVTTMCVLGTVAGVVTWATAGLAFAPLVGWDVAALAFLVSVWSAVGSMDAASTAEHATRENPGRALGDSIVVLASVASLAAVGVVVARANSESGGARDLLAVLAVVSVVLSWFAAHTLFTLRYAELYYSGTAGGVDFNQKSPPCYADFAYLAFTIGMTFQVSDTNLTTSRIRSTALRHALLSYLFGAVILASTINLIVGLGTSGGG